MVRDHVASESSHDVHHPGHFVGFLSTIIKMDALGLVPGFPNGQISFEDMGILY